MKAFAAVVVMSLLCSPASPLTCKHCKPTHMKETCEETEVTCKDSETHCTSSSVLLYQGDRAEFFSKGCANADGCISGSVNLGIAKRVANTKCCDSDLCNTEIPPVPTDAAENGRKCYTCTENCVVIQQCTGEESFCLEARTTIKGEEVLLMGCATKSICSLKLDDSENKIDLKCCENDLCNK